MSCRVLHTIWTKNGLGKTLIPLFMKTSLKKFRRSRFQNRSLTKSLTYHLLKKVLSFNPFRASVAYLQQFIKCFVINKFMVKDLAMF